MSEVLNVSYPGNLRCRATLAAAGQDITTDAPKENGGLGEAFSPTDLLAAALGTCLMTVIGIVAQRSNIDVTGMTAGREGHGRRAGPPRRPHQDRHPDAQGLEALGGRAIEAGECRQDVSGEAKPSSGGRCPPWNSSIRSERRSGPKGTGPCFRSWTFR